MALVPFLKWAGGKRWLAKNHLTFFGNVDANHRYIEPFLGSAAIFFSLTPSRSVLSDSNTELIETYAQIRTHWREIAHLLLEHHKRHCFEYYYKIRSFVYSDPIQRAARFIYLNRTCWNGLYRVNRKNQFNVPIGTKQRVVLPTDDFQAISLCLENARLVSCDFEQTISLAKAGDFIYADPPYTVSHGHNGFLKYNENLFTWEDQTRLRDALVKAFGEGVNVVLSNANDPNIKRLYHDFGEHQYLPRTSVLAANSQHRGMRTELLITALH